jgi:hypothetical protein
VEATIKLKVILRIKTRKELFVGRRSRRWCGSHTEHSQAERLGLWFVPPQPVYVFALTIIRIEPQRTVLIPHSNAVFDLRWHPNDEYVVTASGDQSIVISSVRHENRLTTLAGHTQSVKCVVWEPDKGNTLCSGGRDGSILVWDLRVGENRRTPTDGGELGPCLVIPQAHKDFGTRFTPSGRKVARSITSLTYAVGKPYSIISSGAFDGYVEFG